MGRIGKAVAERAKAFGMQVWATSQKDPIPGLDVRVAPLSEMLPRCDVLSLHCPLTEKTRHLIGRKELSMMKKTAILINTARGALIDEKALVAHLRSNSGFFAGLDVYEAEPEISTGLLELPNSLCMPHIGSATTTTRHLMADICAREAIRFGKGESLHYEWKGTA
jgi:glyoxylate reductase